MPNRTLWLAPNFQTQFCCIPWCSGPQKVQSIKDRWCQASICMLTDFTIPSLSFLINKMGITLIRPS